MNDYLTALTPHLLEMIAAVATFILGWLANWARARWSIEIEARHREALHSALMTGVRHALARGLYDQDGVAKAAVDYVRTSVPDALAALKPRQQLLIEMAAATLEGWQATGRER